MATKHRMTKGSAKEEDFGLIRPSLIRQLRAILDQYPDDGQILKELLQNAEDAKATEVRFLHDEHSYDTNPQHLHHPGLAAFQGAALYAYNDAVFSEKDWTGIRMLQDSVKEKDPLKVGRFGLGFKSVLHMTDLPSVLSRDRLAVIDPHEKYFKYKGQGTTGYSWKLKERRADLAAIPAQTHPFLNLFNCDQNTFTQGNYSGTLFRFPLRVVPSELSETVYNRDKMSALFQSFQADAHLVLIFLKSVETVELSTRTKEQNIPVLNFRVRISPDCVQQVRSHRQAFISAIDTNRWLDCPVIMTYPVTIETTTFTNGIEADEQIFRYLVSEHYAGGEASVHLKALHKDPVLSHIPLVGVAMPLDDSEKIKRERLLRSQPKPAASEDDERKADRPGGHVFCFLPLPLEQKSATGLPIHVNGYFSISQNRRHLKWPTAGHKPQSDKALLWNQCLLQELVPKAYCSLIIDAINMNKSDPTSVSHERIVQALPNLIEVDEKWSIVLPSLYATLFNHTIFWTPRNNGTWVKIDDAIFDCMKETDDTKAAIIQVLISGNISVVKMPMYVLHAMGAFSSHSPEIISPSLVRQVLLHSTKSCSQQPLDRLLLLLAYILKDEDFRELIGINLLPLASGKFTAFTEPSAALGIYIPSDEHPRSLLATLGDCLLADGLPDTLLHKLFKLADEGCTQLRRLDSNSVAELLPRVIPSHWYKSERLEWNLNSSDVQLPPAWLQQVWDYLRKHFPSDLSRFSGLPILALSHEECKIHLVPLTLPSVTIARNAMGSELDEGVVACLESMFLHVARELPSYIINHAGVLGNYIRLPIPEDVVDAVVTMCKRKGNKCFEKLQSVDADAKRQLRKLFSKMEKSQMTAAHKKVLLNMPVFETAKLSDDDDDIRFVSLTEVKRAAPLSLPDISIKETLVDLKEDTSRTLAKALGVFPMSTAELLAEVVFRDIILGKLDGSQIQVVMTYVLENLHVLNRENSNFGDQLKKVPFVASKSGLHRPTDLCDPESEVLQDMFFGDDVFPQAEYSEPAYLVLLRQLGLRTEDDLHAVDVYQCVHSIEEQFLQLQDGKETELLKEDIKNDQLQENKQSDTASGNEESDDIEEDNTEKKIPKYNETLNKLVKKSAAVMRHLDRHPHRLDQTAHNRTLKQWLCGIPWVASMQERLPMYPDSLKWLSGPVFACPRQLSSMEWFPVVAGVTSLCKEPAGPDVSHAFNWDQMPRVETVIAQLAEVVRSYDTNEKAKYLAIITSIYDYLAQQNIENVQQALQAANLTKWIWHGDGFITADKVVLTKPQYDMRPFKYPLPAELQLYKSLFRNCGIQEKFDFAVLIDVLHDIKAKHKCIAIEGTGPADESKKEEINRDLQLAVDILNQLKVASQELDDSQREKILIPVTTDEDDWTLRLVPIEEATFCDTEWLRQGFFPMSFDEQDGILFIHPLVPMTTAESLGVPSLMSRMLHAEELNVTGFGQSEPLTNRLKRLLEDYTDGFAIPKELVQNADDAGATEVCFLYDERTNSEHMKFLIDDGMKECHGPALWVHNNAIFTDNDFENITKLGGATKEKEVDKIGKFGLGFNAVYNITDVPSFISRNYLVIFDPHTTHLGRGIKDRTRPGIRLDMMKNKTLLKKLPDQFKPFEKVFGCKVDPNGDCNYKGTLFRFPLRTEEQAAKSDISQRYYDKTQMLDLLTLFAKGASNLLLFTQNVERVKLYHLQADETDPSNATLVFDVNKQLIQTMHGQPEAVNVISATEGCATQQTFSALPQAAVGIGTVKKQRKLAAIQDIAKSLVLSVKVDAGPASEHLLGKNINLSDTHWLVSYAMGKGRALKMSLTHQEDGFIPIGSVAVPLEKKNDCLMPQTLSDTGCKGSIFCYLPLPIQTGLPVHINGSFAVQPNRRYLSERTADDKHSVKADWNEALLEDAVCGAYLQSLQHCSLLNTETEMIEYFRLWPALTDVTPNLMCLLQKFYFELLKIEALPLLKTETAVIHLDQAVFLDPFLAEYTGIGKIAMKIFRQHHGDDRVVEVPQFVMESFTGAGHADFIIDKTYSHDQFFAEIFFPNIEKYSADLRDPLVLYAIDLSKPTLDQLLFNTACIPVDEKGEHLRKPCDLVHPYLPFAKLFDPADQRFPCGEQFKTRERLVALQKLGMQTTDLTWQDITERAESIQNLHNDNQHEAHLRLQQLCAFLDRKLTQERTVKTSAGFSSQALEAQERIQEMEMLPIAEKPKHFPLSWAGEQYKAGTLLAPDVSYPKTSFYLLSSTQPLVEDQYMSDQVKYFLGLSIKDIPLGHVLVQLEHALALDPSELALKNDEEYKELFRCCHKIYEYLQKECLKDEETANGISAALRERKCLLIGSEFVSPLQVAFTSGGDCSPYLYCLPAELNRRFKPFMTMLGVRPRFSSEDYVQAMNLLQSEVGGSPLKGQKLETSIQLVNQLDACMRHENMTTEDVQKHGIVYIPNAKGILQPADELCYNDCPWLKSTNTMNFTHPSIAYQISTSLGVKTKRQEALSKHSKGIPFGQKERLTNSLRRILNTYPCDHEILKEMIQNADDAQASDIHFVKDVRHHKDTHVFENSWKKLQGPALCVYNNKPFSQADLEGIQNLGEGSKVHDPSKTGQYGIGFSSVYHLTDVPSLLTSSPELGDTLCVFDPHCSYVPGATPSEPGMRFDDLPSLREAFPDVFSCYLEEQFKLSNATLFRLPLRNRAMAERSDISKNTMTVPKLQTMLSQLRNEAFEILLFTNHLKQICISDIDSNTGQLANTYSVFANMSKTDLEKRQEFHLVIKKYNEMLKNGEITVDNIPNTTVMYDMLIADSEGRQESWRVTQSLGFDESAEIPHSVIQAFERGDLALLPRGGAACLLEKRLNGRMEEDNRNRRVYCFLPLPIETELPVHINGHFALGYENRRHLWTPTGDSGYKFEWNHILCTEVITESYVRLLESIRMHGLNAQMEDDIAKVYCSRQILEGAIHAYQGYFPTFSETKPEWDSLVRSVYQRIACDELPLLPAIRENPQEVEVKAQQNVPSASLWHVSWLPPNGEGSKKAFFSKLEKSEAVEDQRSFIGKFRSFFRGSTSVPEKTDAQILKELLLDCGFKLLEATPVVVENFQKAGVDIDFMSPEGVLLFFKSYSKDKCICELGTLPAKVEETPFRDARTVRIALEYCKTNPVFLENLDGLPLLLTKDNIVRVFDSENPVFVTKYDELIPQRADLFVHPSLKASIFNEINLDSTDVFHQFTIDAFAEILSHRFEAEKYKCQNKPVEWSKHFKYFPTESWLREVWSFIWTELEFILKRNNRDKDRSEVLQQREIEVRDQLEALKDWSLIPAKKQTKNVLISVEQASDILDLRNLDYNHYGVRDILIKLQIPQLDWGALNSDSTRNADLVRLMTTTMDKPKAVLDLVHKTIVESDGFVNLSKEESVKLLRYFSDNIDKLVGSEEAQQKLKDLPIYNTIHGDLIKLTGCLVYTLPAKIPTDDIDVWQSKSGTVFLERNDSLQNLYDYLGCATIGVRDVYCQFILQHFEYLSPEARMVHLQHIYQQYIKQGASGSDFTEQDKEMFMESLKELNFIEDKEGGLHSASDYYDPENVLFRVMLPEEKLPPRAGTLFKESDWLTFLRKLGLKSEVTKEMTLEFAQKVAYEGNDTQSASALTKSKVLTQHLLTMQTPEKTKILEDVAEIKFIAPEPVSQELANMYPQYGDIGNGKLAYVSFKDSVSKDHEKLIWTQSSILPTWADPMKQHQLPQEEKLQLIECLQVRKIPPAELVVLNLKNLIDQFKMETAPLEGYKAKARIEVFKAIYRYLQQHALEDEEAKEKLEDMPCIAVENSRCFVKPKYTVLNLYQTEEIKPFLYKVPLEFGEFEALLNSLGSTVNATFDQYASVLSTIAEITGPERLTPNEMRTSYKAVRGLFSSIEKDPSKADITTTILYLPAESGRLIDSTKLVFNDMPSFYDRVKNLGLQFLVDLKECGIKYRNFEDMLNQLPQRLCPGMLSSIVKETLVDKVKKSVTSSGIAAHLSSRLTSEALLRAVARLVRHECHKSGRKLDEPAMFGVLDRLSTIKVYGVSKVLTHLTCRGRAVPGSEMEKTCFVERIHLSGPDIWNVYIKNDAELSQDLLIPLAEVINSILTGLLRDSVLYLLPLLACSESEMHNKLDSLNVRVDHTQLTSRIPTLPPAGETVPEELLKLLRPVTSTTVPSGDYVAYTPADGSTETVYAVCQGVVWESSELAYMLEIGEGPEGLIVAPATSMQQFAKRQ